MFLNRRIKNTGLEDMIVIQEHFTTGPFCQSSSPSNHIYKGEEVSSLSPQSRPGYQNARFLLFIWSCPWAPDYKNVHDPPGTATMARIRHENEVKTVLPVRVRRSLIDSKRKTSVWHDRIALAPQGQPKTAISVCSYVGARWGLIARIVKFILTAWHVLLPGGFSMGSRVNFEASGDVDSGALSQYLLRDPHVSESERKAICHSSFMWLNSVKGWIP